MKTLFLFLCGFFLLILGYQIEVIYLEISDLC